MLRTACGLCCLVLLSGCGGGSGDGSSPQQSQALAPSGALKLTGTPVTRLWEGESYSFQPRAIKSQSTVLLEFDATNLPSWASFDTATGRLYGVPGTVHVGVYPNIRIHAKDGTHESWLPPFDILVEPVSHGAAILSWTPPSQNTDNSPLQDLAGFRIYGGTNPLDLTEFAFVGGAGVSSHLLDNLSPGKYYFASAAVNGAGVESDPSNFTIILVR